MSRAVLFVTTLFGLSVDGQVRAQVTVRHQIFSDRIQAFVNGLPFADFSREIGFRYYDAATEAEVGDPCNCAGLGTDNFILNIANSAAWSNADPDQAPGFNHQFNNEVRFLFRGTGVDLHYAAHAVGENLAWEIVDGGAEGNFQAVASGNFSTFNPTSVDRTAELVSAGTLPSDRLHMLRVWPQETSPTSTTERWISLDAFDVHGVEQFTIDDSLNGFDAANNPDGTWVPSVSWGDDFDAGTVRSIGGGVNRSDTDGATMNILFNGSSVAIFGRQSSGVADLVGEAQEQTAQFDWKINEGGPGLEGTIDQTIDSNFSFRWPHVVVNGLPYGEHTLEITARNGGQADTYAELDAISVISFRDLGVQADFDIDQGVDGADFLSWQRGFGTSPDASRPDGDANRDRTVNDIDLQIWQNDFGNVVDNVASLQSLAVPEPSSLTLLGSMVLLFGVRRRSGISG